MKTKVLFVCVHNSARSQMAEAFVNRYCGDQFEAASAGLEPGTLNPLAVEAMAEDGIDISAHTTKSIWDTFREGHTYGYIVTVCDETNEKCPIFPGNGIRLHWSFPDPAQSTGTHEEQLAQFRQVRDAISAQITAWYQEKSAASEVSH